MQPFWRWRVFLFWLAAVFAVGIIGCFTPLMETLGYEFSLLISLVVSLGAGHIAACYPQRCLKRNAESAKAKHTVLFLFVCALFLGLALAAVPYALSIINSLRVEPCNDIQGTYFYLLMPGCSAVIAVATGLFVGTLVPSSRWASFFWFLIFAASLVNAFREFYQSPVVYSFGPFFGYFPGALYDRVVRVETRFITYRIASLLQTSTLLAIMSLLMNPETLRLTFRRIRSRSKTAIAAVILIAASIGMYAAGPYFRHRTNRENLEFLLGWHAKAGKLDLYFPAKIDPRLASMLIEEAEFSLNQVEKYLNVETLNRIAVFFFASSAQKAYAMGARETNIAKPWRNEVYVIVEPPPHSVLRHELAHVVAGTFSKGLFKIPGALGGLLPNPGLTEGLAVAAGGPRDDLTIHQWAAAMKRLKLLPDLDEMFGYEFYGFTASRAYIAAGSFVDWMHQNIGAKMLSEAYSTGDVEATSGVSLAVLENQWQAYLSSVLLTEEDLAAAKHRFDRPSIIHTICVHETARLESEAEEFAERGQWDQAFDLLEQAYEKSGRSTFSKLKRFFAYVDAKKISEVRGWAKTLSKDPDISSVYAAQINEAIADQEIKIEDTKERAKKIYIELAKAAVDESERRRLQVKAYLADLGDDIVNQVIEVLAGRPGPETMSIKSSAGAIFKAAESIPSDPVLNYLAARQHFNLGDFAEAIAGLDKADSLGISRISTSLDLETRMLRGKALFYLGQYKKAEAVFAAIADDKLRRLGARAFAQDWREHSIFKEML